MIVNASTAPPETAALDQFVEIAAEIACDPDAFRGEATRALFVWWRDASAACQGGLPPRRAFDILDHTRIAADLFLVQVIDETSFCMKVQGDNVISLIGRSNMGRVFRLAKTVDSKEYEIAEHYARVVASRTAWRCRGSAAVFDKSYLSVESVDCPLADPATGRITHIVGVLQEMT